jgi:hypothetical protein
VSVLTSRRAIVGIAVVGLLGLMPAVSVAASASGRGSPTWSGPMHWNVRAAFAKNPTLNPAPDTYGNPGVWSWMYGSPNTPSTYALDTFELGCGSKHFDQWSDHGANPFVLYNRGKAILGACGSADVWPKHSIIVSPGCTCYGTGAIDSIISWTSPITGTVTVAGTVQGANKPEPGITWELDQGSTILLGPNPENKDQVADIGPVSVSVTAGQSLYVEIGNGGDSGAYDDAVFGLTIKEQSATAALP